MSQEFAQMDSYTSEDIAQFKEEARLREPISMLEATSPEIKTLVAEGDSWFDYLPGTDIIDCLRFYHNYQIETFAEAGDTLENMIYGTQINTHSFERLSPTIQRVLRRLGNLKPKVFLFSGGGNDVAGKEFESYLNHKDSGLPILREQFVKDMVLVVFRKYYKDLIAKVATVSPDTYIITHGYGHTAPTGKGVEVLFYSFAGPWLRPALTKKGINETSEQKNAVFSLINLFNEMLADLARHYPKFRYIDLRNIIDADRDWVNELHLHNSAFARVAKRIHEEIDSLP